MTITLTTDNIRKDIYLKSYLQFEAETDLDTKRVARIEEDKVDELDRCILYAAGMLEALVQRFLTEQSPVTAGGDGLSNIANTFTYNLDFKARRLIGKAVPLADVMHSYVVNLAMSRFYMSASQPKLAQVFQELAATDAAGISKLIYFKAPPKKHSHA